MRHKPDPDTLGADQADNLFNFIQQHLRRVVKQQVRFVKEEHQFGFFQIACFRQLFVQFREHPQQAGGVKLRHLVELLCAQNVDDAFAAAVGTHPVFDIQHWLAEEVFGTLLLQRQEPALNGAHRGAADIAVLVLEGFGVIANVLGDGAQIFEVEQQ